MIFVCRILTAHFLTCSPQLFIRYFAFRTGIMILFSVVLLLFTPIVSGHTVTVGLTSKWYETPILAESSEFFATESNSVFWSYIEACRNEINEKKTDKQVHETILKLAERFFTPQKVNLLKWSMALRAHSPTVYMFEKIPHEFNLFTKTKCEHSFVDVHGEMVCTKEELLSALKKANNRQAPLSFPFDHFMPSCGLGKYGDNTDYPTVVLYAELGTAEFYQWHDFIVELCSSNAAGFSFRYIFRHFRPPSAIPKQKIRLSGYGVELVIKNTEYKAKDDTEIKAKSDSLTDGFQGEDLDEVQGFLFGKLKNIYPQLDNELDRFKQYLLDTESNEMHQLKAWEYQDLSVLAAGAISQSAAGDNLKMLTEISSNFPVQLRWLLRESVSQPLVKELTRNQKIFADSYNLAAGENGLYINGIQFEVDSLDIFQVLSTLSAEASLMDGLHSILSGKQDLIGQLVKMDLGDASKQKYSLDLRNSGDAIHWVNNLEKDKQYAQWPRSVTDLLQPTFPGMLRYVRKNLFNLVLFADPANPDCWPLIKLAEAMYVHNTPLRIGLVMLPNETNPISKLLVRGFHAVSEDLKGSQMHSISFLTELYDFIKEDPSAMTEEAIFDQVRQTSGDKAVARMKDTEDEGITKTMEAVDELWKRSGFTQLPVVTINGNPVSSDSLTDSAEDAILTEVLRATPDLQRAVYHRELDDKMDAFDYVFSRPSVVPRLSTRFLGGAKKFVDFVSKTSTKGEKDIKKMDSPSLIAKWMKDAHYFVKKDDKTAKPVTTWLVVDPETTQGRQSILNGFKHLSKSGDSRLGFVVNSKSSEPKFSTKVLLTAIEKFNSAPAKGISQLLGKLFKEEDIGKYESGEKNFPNVEIPDIDISEFQKFMKTIDMKEKLELDQQFATKSLNLEKGQQTLIVNGRIYSPLTEGEVFVKDDFYLVERMIRMLVAEKIVFKIRNSYADAKPVTISDLALKIDSLLAERAANNVGASLFSGTSKRRTDVVIPESKYAALNVKPRNSEESAFEVIAIVDPASRDASKISKFIETMFEVTNSWVRVYFNCKQKLSELPVKSFYRYVLEPSLQFSDTGALSQGPLAHFATLPQKPLLTTQVHPPESWMVESIVSQYDLDNICLDEFGTNVNAVFELKNVLVEGHCFDQKSGQPPRGLQFTLGTPRQPIMYDTIVMANLGYFQLKAEPGIWLLALREGRSSDLYTIKSQQFADSPANSQQYETILVAVNSFKSKIIKINVAKKPG